MPVLVKRSAVAGAVPPSLLAGELALNRADGELYYLSGADAIVSLLSIDCGEVYSPDWDVSAATFVRSFSVASQSTSPQSIALKPDGTRMYVSSISPDDEVQEYSLSTAWDVSTASYVQAFALASSTGARGVSFKPDGTRMYVVGVIGSTVNEYALSTAWDVSSASLSQTISVSADAATPHGIAFKFDGTRMYVVSEAGDDVNEYALATAWDISTAAFVRSLSVSAQETVPRGISFKPDGKQMFVVGDFGKDVNEYSLATAWDISSAVFVQSFGVSAQETAPSGLAFKPDGTRMYIVGFVGDKVTEYSLSGVPAPSAPSVISLWAAEALDFNWHWSN